MIKAILTLALAACVASPLHAAAQQILSGPLADLDFKEAVIEKGGVPRAS